MRKKQLFKPVLKKMILMKKSIFLSILMSLFAHLSLNQLAAQTVFEPELIDTTLFAALPQGVDTVQNIDDIDDIKWGANANQPSQKALVIGIANYLYEQKLRGPVNDARAIADVLRKSHWKVSGYENLPTRASFQHALNKFVADLKPTDEALFYFSGHGFQYRKNYLVPAQANIQQEQDIETQAFPLEAVMQGLLKSKCRVRVVILDACRNNIASAPKRIAGLTVGLKLVTAENIRVKPNNQGNKTNPEISTGGTLVAYATAPGQPARDGKQFSMFTGALKDAFAAALTRNPCISITEALQEARGMVLTKTKGAQVPWESSSLTGKVQICAPKK